MMKRLWIPIIIISMIVSAFSLFYVAVGAAAEENKPSVPDEVAEEQRRIKEKNEFCLSLSSMPADVYCIGDKVTVGAPVYGGAGMYSMEYTVSRAYLCDALPLGINESDISERKGYSNGALEEGYTFLAIDVVIENKCSEKQMYIVNSATVDGYELLGFAGQKFKNTARLHTELYPDTSFETTLVYVIREENAIGLQLYINNFGYGSANGTCAFVDL